MVGAAGLELATSCSQSRRSSQLSYAPTGVKMNDVSKRVQLRDHALNKDNCHSAVARRARAGATSDS